MGDTPSVGCLLLWQRQLTCGRAGRSCPREGGVGLSEIDLIGTQELKEKLDRGDNFKLIMVLGEWEYKDKHIPSSLRVSTMEEALKVLLHEEEIVIYDSGPQCPASRMACRILKHHGYHRVRRYAGGLEEWEEAGHPLEREGVSAGG